MLHDENIDNIFLGSTETALCVDYAGLWMSSQTERAYALRKERSMNVPGLYNGIVSTHDLTNRFQCRNSVVHAASFSEP